MGKFLFRLIAFIAGKHQAQSCRDTIDSQRVYKEQGVEPKKMQRFSNKLYGM